MKNCVYCDNVMSQATIIFAVVEEDTFFLVEDAPCFVCSVCQHVGFEPQVAKELEHCFFGKLCPTRSRTALVYKWDQRRVTAPFPSELSSQPIPFDFGG